MLRFSTGNGTHAYLAIMLCPLSADVHWAHPISIAVQTSVAINKVLYLIHFALIAPYTDEVVADEPMETFAGTGWMCRSEVAHRGNDVGLSHVASLGLPHLRITHFAGTSCKPVHNATRHKSITMGRVIRNQRKGRGSIFSKLSCFWKSRPPRCDTHD